MRLHALDFRATSNYNLHELKLAELCWGCTCRLPRVHAQKFMTREDQLKRISPRRSSYVRRS
jgi:hypothetical protein